MAVTEEDVRKALEDLVHANIVEIFNISYGETSCLAGVETPIEFIKPYDAENDYIVGIIEAYDVNDIDIRPSIEARSFTANGFILYSPRNTTVKWTATRRVPKINFWTE